MGVTIGTIRKTEKGSILVLNKGIELSFNGTPVKINEMYRSLSLFDSAESANKLATLGHLDDENLEKKLSYITEKNIVKDVVAFEN